MVERLTQLLPFAFGLTFVPTDALSPAARSARTPAAALVRACAELEASFAFVPAAEPWAESAVRALNEAGVAPFWSVGGPLWPVVESYGVQAGLRALLTRPDEVAEALDARLGTIAAEIARGAELGVRAVVLAEDLAGSAGPLVAPDFVIGELIPRFDRVLEVAREWGLPVVLHSDGDIRPLLSAIARAGFVAVHAGGGLDFAGFERLFRLAHADGLAVLGGMMTVELTKGLPAAVSLGAKVGVLAESGGLLVTDDGGITEPAQVSALVTALAAARG